MNLKEAKRRERESVCVYVREKDRIENKLLEDKMFSRLKKKVQQEQSSPNTNHTTTSTVQQFNLNDEEIKSTNIVKKKTTDLNFFKFKIIL